MAPRRRSKAIPKPDRTVSKSSWRDLGDGDVFRGVSGGWYVFRGVVTEPSGSEYIDCWELERGTGGQLIARSHRTLSLDSIGKLNTKATHDYEKGKA